MYIFYFETSHIYHHRNSIIHRTVYAHDAPRRREFGEFGDALLTRVAAHVARRARIARRHARARAVEEVRVLRGAKNARSIARRENSDEGSGATIRDPSGDSRDPIGSRRTRGTSRDIARASVTRGKARASTRGREGRARAVRGEGGGDESEDGARARDAETRETSERLTRTRDSRR